LTTVHEWLRGRLLRRVGLEPAPDLEQIRREQWCPDFVRKMSNRMVVGWFRYGPIRDPAARPYDNVGSAIERLQDYLRDGNLEHLVDAANLCLIEYVKGPRGVGSHPSPTWQPKDDGKHTRLVEPRFPKPDPDATPEEIRRAGAAARWPR